MHSENAFSVDFAFLCDDVRREDNGKNMFIGAYLGGVTAYHTPFTGFFKLATFLSFSEPPEFELIATSLFNGVATAKRQLSFTKILVRRFI